MSTEDFKMARLSQEATHTTANLSMSRRRLLTRVAPAGLAGAVLAAVSSPALAWASVDMNSKTAHARAFQQSQSAYYAAIFEQISGPAWQARHGLTADQYQQTFNQFVAQGYRPTLVDGYSVNDQALYAAIFEQISGPAWQARHGLTADQYQQTFNQMVAQGYRPVDVSGYGVNGQAYYTAIFEQRDGPAWQARHGLTADQYQQTFDQLVAQGYRPVDVSGYGVNGQALYAAIFEQRDTVTGPAWQARHGLTADQYQQVFDQLVAQDYRPTLVDGYNVNGQALYAAIFEQRDLPPPVPAWVARHGLTADQYQQTFDQLVAQGYRLLWVSGYGV